MIIILNIINNLIIGSQIKYDENTWVQEGNNILWYNTDNENDQ